MLYFFIIRSATAQADAGLSPRGHGFNCKVRVVQAEFVVDTESLEQVFLETLGFFFTSTILRVTHNLNLLFMGSYILRIF
jgi:hypothetical protein